MPAAAARRLAYRTNFIPPDDVKVDPAHVADDTPDGHVTYDAGEDLPEWAVGILEQAGQLHYLQPTEA